MSGPGVEEGFVPTNRPLRLGALRFGSEALSQLLDQPLPFEIDVDHFAYRFVSIQPKRATLAEKPRLFAGEHKAAQVESQCPFEAEVFIQRQVGTLCCACTKGGVLPQPAPNAQSNVWKKSAESGPQAGIRSSLVLKPGLFERAAEYGRKVRGEVMARSRLCPRIGWRGQRGKCQEETKSRGHRRTERHSSPARRARCKSHASRRLRSRRHNAGERQGAGVWCLTFVGTSSGSLGEGSPLPRDKAQTSPPRRNQRTGLPVRESPSAVRVSRVRLEPS